MIYNHKTWNLIGCSKLYDLKSTKEARKIFGCKFQRIKSPYEKVLVINSWFPHVKDKRMMDTVKSSLRDAFRKIHDYPISGSRDKVGSGHDISAIFMTGDFNEYLSCKNCGRLEKVGA